MWFKAASQPLCRQCGKPIAKVTDWVYPPGSFQADTGLYSKADCQQQTNLKVLSVRYACREDRRWVRAYSVWDGETYEDEFFDRNECAYLFARACAGNNNLAMPAYNEALRRHNPHA